MIWYNCALCNSNLILDWNNFFIFNLFQIVSTCRFRNACVRWIFIELFINKINFHSFFFFLFFYINWYVQTRKWLLSCITKMTFLVYYEAFVRWLYIDSKNLIKVWCSRFACDTSALRQYFNISFFLFMTFWIWESLSFFAVI